MDTTVRAAWVAFGFMACAFVPPAFVIFCGCVGWLWRNRHHLTADSSEEKETLIDNESGIAYGGIAVIITTIIAMVLYICIIPVWEILYPLMTDLDAKSPNLVMQARIDTGYDLFLILPVIMIGISVIFFALRSIRRQAYSREYEEEFR